MELDAARPEPSLDGVRVLLVEDYPVVREVITRLLEWSGARVTAVPGVSEALVALGQERPNVMLSDIAMPGEDGYALIRKVRALAPDQGGQIPAAAFTGLCTAEEPRVLQAGYRYCVAKPVDARRLVALVATLAAEERGGVSPQMKCSVEAPLTSRVPDPLFNAFARRLAATRSEWIK